MASGRTTVRRNTDMITINNPERPRVLRADAQGAFVISPTPVRITVDGIGGKVTALAGGQQERIVRVRGSGLAWQCGKLVQEGRDGGIDLLAPYTQSFPGRFGRIDGEHHPRMSAEHGLEQLFAKYCWLTLESGSIHRRRMPLGKHMGVH